MKLLVDIGNRRLKWATTSNGVFDDAGAFAHVNTPDLTAEWGELKRPDSVWICCVAGAKIRAAVADFARQQWALQANLIAAQKRAAGVVNAYPKPATLGGDRWAALLAARALFPRQSLIIVDAGTAVTVDLLGDDGVHQGGVILPGVHAMSAALHDQTANLAAVDLADDAPPDAVATDTETAIANGALLAVAGGINAAVARQQAAAKTECRVILTGGDAEKIAPLLDTAITTTEPQLVLKGIAILAQ